ncbi:MAG TPA: sulfotransferase [Solirubrobacterales bacterium]|jgi:hypothetical protein
MKRARRRAARAELRQRLTGHWLRGRAGPAERPLVILGTGGSGTRAVASLAREAGYYMGSNLNPAGDSLDLGRLMRHWPNRYLRVSNWVDEMWRGPGRRRFPFPSAMAPDFTAAIEEHRRGLGDPRAAWGWKAPRTILLLPFVHEMLPSARIVHLVRDGRDMAYSRNQNQVRRHGRKVLPPSDKRIAKAHASIMFWARLNLAAARYGERYIGSNRLLLRFEDLCADPGATAMRLVEFLQCSVPEDRIRAAAAEIVRPPDSLGRWRDRESRRIRAIERRGEPALREFGYL